MNNLFIENETPSIGTSKTHEAMTSSQFLSFIFVIFTNWQWRDTQISLINILYIL